MTWQKVSLLLALVVVISGCTSLDGLFGSDVINVQEKVVESGERDVIIVKDIQTIPKSPLLPDQEVVFSFILENRDNLEAADVYVDLFNAPTMKESCANGDSCRPCNLYVSTACAVKQCPSGMPCARDGDCNAVGGGTCECFNEESSFANQRICVPDDNMCGVGNPCPILPREEKPINFLILTPSEEDIQSIQTKTTLDFRTVYRFSSSLNYIVPAVSSDEIIKRQRTGEKINLFQNKAVSSGPIQIDAEIIGAPYIFSNGANSPETIINFRLRNRGSGSVINSEIKPGAMRISFPPELVVTNEGDKFTCTNGICVNDKIDQKSGKQMGAIQLFRDESRSALRFTVKVQQAFEEPFRSFPISAVVDYDYELRNSHDITINPFQNVG